MTFEPEMELTPLIPYHVKDLQEQKGKQGVSPALPDIKIIELLMYAMEEAYRSSQFLNGLSQRFSNKKDKEAIYNMYLDRLKHYKLLQETYFRVAEKFPRKLIDEEFAYSPQLYEELEKTFYDTKKATNTLKKLLFAFATITQRDVFYEIFLDIECHLSEISMLFAKYR